MRWLGKDSSDNEAPRRHDGTTKESNPSWQLRPVGTWGNMDDETVRLKPMP